MKKIVIIFMIFSLTISIFATQQNTFELQRLAEKFRIEYEQKKAEAVKVALEKGWVIREVTPDGTIIELQALTENGIPLYYITHNLSAAITVGTDELWPGGSTGLYLTGSGLTWGLLGEWDGGDVRLTHQELIPRVIDMDGSTVTSGHSTHVAGTLIASGNYVYGLARGMAFQGTLHAYDWISDYSEMATAASNGMLLSNHSYGHITGWNWNGSSWIWYGDPLISTLEDYRFGFYSSYSRQVDIIASNASNYLIVKSAGNHRDDTGSGTYPPDGNQGTGYDCIGVVGSAKNILTVGAVEDIIGGYSGPGSVVMEGYSSWGPCDDGRIKPDIVANGQLLGSCDNISDDSYSSHSGTSMSTPNTTGTLALLQTYYFDWMVQNLNASYMTAASLKGLVIHTADEAGSNNGPDYKFGWGLLNAEGAANVIKYNGTTDYILETSLSNGGYYQININSDGTTPLVATICWTDTAHAALSPALDPTTKMLVNDLDMRITRSSSTYYPWKLVAASPSNAATNNSDNNTDNVEKVELSNPSSDEYTITVTHKGTLSSSQNYSLIISGIDSSVLVSTPTFSPPAGTYGTTQSVTISCATSGSTIYYTTDGSDPDDTDLVYSSPISISSSQTLKAIAYHILWTPSSISEAVYVLNVSNGSGDNSGDTSGPAVVDMPITNIDGNSVDPDVSIDPEGTLAISVDVTVTDEVQSSTPVPNPDNVIISYAVDVFGTITGVNLVFDLEFTGLSSLDQIHWLNGTNWEAPNNVSWSTPNHVTFDLTLSGRDGSTEIILSQDDPLPVTLSSFTAVFYNGTPVIIWTTQSENNNSGWNIYRSESSNAGQSQKINFDLIPGAGTTSEPTEYSFMDEYETVFNQTYWYWLESISGSGETETFGPVTLTIPFEEENTNTIPVQTKLWQNYPNPFNPITYIKFDVKENEVALLTIFNVKGQIVLSQEFETGRYDHDWDARDYGSGIYFYKLQSASYSQIKKMILVK